MYRQDRHPPQNKLTLGDPFSDDAPADQVVLDAALASRPDNDDTIDLAVRGGLSDNQALDTYQVLHFQPFDPVHKRTEASVKGANGKPFKVTKGAPQAILELSANAEQVTPAVEQAVNEFAARGFRSLAVARTDGDSDSDWQFLGVLPLFDPPRDDAKATIATARQMGVHVKMVTGDQVAIAQETAKKLAMGTDILDASSLGEVKQQETSAAAEAIENADGFAQVFPEHNSTSWTSSTTRPHRRHDRRRRQWRPRAEESRLRHRRLRRDGRRPRRGRHRPDDTRPVVIIDAIKVSRKIFQRMNSYATYRITETLRVLLFMILAS